MASLNNEGYGQILLVEDDLELAQLTASFLQNNSYEVAIESDGLLAPQRVRSESPDLVILDIMLPGQDGLEVCKQVRTFYHGPIILLTARAQGLDEIIGLEVGADDFLAKPVEPQRLLARIRAHLRRAHHFNPVTDTQQAPTALKLDRLSRRVFKQGEDCQLTDPEYDLYVLLSSEPGRIFSRDDITMHLRGIEYDGFSRAVDIMVSSLRQKLGDGVRIRSVRGRGYLFSHDS